MATVMTNENKPNVKKVIGKLIIFRMGFTKEFKNPIAKATMMAVVNPSTVMPFKLRGITNTPQAMMM